MVNRKKKGWTPEHSLDQAQLTERTKREAGREASRYSAEYGVFKSSSNRFIDYESECVARGTPGTLDRSLFPIWHFCHIDRIVDQAILIVFICTVILSVSLLTINDKFSIYFGDALGILGTFLHSLHIIGNRCVYKATCGRNGGSGYGDHPETDAYSFIFYLWSVPSRFSLKDNIVVTLNQPKKYNS